VGVGQKNDAAIYVTTPKTKKDSIGLIINYFTGATISTSAPCDCNDLSIATIKVIISMISNSSIPAFSKAPKIVCKPLIKLSTTPCPCAANNPNMKIPTKEGTTTSRLKTMNTKIMTITARYTQCEAVNAI